MKPIFTKTVQMLIAILFTVECGMAQTPPMLWGMTYYGGSLNYGNIFSLLGNGNNGIDEYECNSTTIRNPFGNLIQCSNGLLYGMTWGYNYGRVFNIDPITRACTVIHNFNNTDGAMPRSSLIEVNGTLYGMTQLGGSNNFGVLFKLNLDGSNFSVIHNFTDTATDGKSPLYSNLLWYNNMLFGMTENGGSDVDGIIFKIDTAGGNFSIVHNFYVTSGANPTGSLIAVNGKLWGMTSDENTGNGGVIFNIDSVTNTYTVFHTFMNGDNPHGSLLFKNNLLWGMSTNGGANHDGAFFHVDPTNSSTYIYFFNFDAFNHPDWGANPYGSFICGSDNYLYGMVTGGSLVYKINPGNTNFYSTISDLLPENGSEPYGDLKEVTLTRTTGNIITTLCQGTSFPVSFTLYGPVTNSNNVFTVQLSDASGSFAYPTTIGSAMQTNNNPILATIPMNTPHGLHYRIRVVGGNSPVIPSFDNGADITIGNILFTIVGSTTTCANDSVNLDAGIHATYLWNTGDTIESLYVHPGIYSVTVTNNSVCSGTAADTITVAGHLTPVITGNRPTAFCFADSVILDEGYYTSYLWNTNDTMETITVYNTGTYTVTVADSHGCIGSGSINIIAHPLPTPVILTTSSPSICFGDSD